MSDKFPLLQQLQKQNDDPNNVSPLPKGIKYDQRTVIVENNEIEVFIPSREVDAFDQAISDCGKYVGRNEFSTLMRKHRGVRNWE